MTETRAPRTAGRSRVREGIDPILIGQVRRIGWVWFGAFVVSAAVVTAIAVQLPDPAWFVLPGGRASASSVHAIVPWGLLVLGWGLVLLFAVSALADRELARPNRLWPMVVLVVLGVLEALLLGALVTGAILQLVHQTPLDASGALRRLADPVQLVGGLAALAAVLSLIVVPGVLATRRVRQRRLGRD